ncbi:MAG: hypothetical protein E7652_08560 [Ruminococcaceae bacterium]|nr:hypothetical protein [Oscillospiraceae bacterium]
MKRLVYILLALSMVITAVSCSNKKNNDKGAQPSDTTVSAQPAPLGEAPYDTEFEEEEPETVEIPIPEPINEWNVEFPASEELGGILIGEEEPADGSDPLISLDETDPLICIANIERDVTLSDGTEGTSYIRIPYINLGIEGALTMSENIYNYYSERFSAYFNEPDDRIIKIDFRYEIRQDVLCIFITESIQTPAALSEMTYGYYYDILVDVEIDMETFIGYCGFTAVGIQEGLRETEWAARYYEETGNYPDHSIFTAVAFNISKNQDISNTFDVYCTNTDNLTQSMIMVTPVKQELDLSMLEQYTY